MTLRERIADLLWQIDSGDISQDREYYLERADDIIVMVRQDKS